VRGQEIAAKQAETVPGVASVQAMASARREGGREFQALGPDARKDRSLVKKLGQPTMGSQTILKLAHGCVISKQLC